MKRFIKKQMGFTLVEVAIVVAIAALLLLGLTQAPKIIAANKANAEISELPQIVANIQKIYAHQPSFSGADLQTLIGLNAFPESRVVSNTAARNRWGGQITVGISGTNDENLVLTYQDVPPEECTSLIPGVEGNFRTISVNSVPVKEAGNALSVTALATGCQVAGTVVYTFTKYAALNKGERKLS